MMKISVTLALAVIASINAEVAMASCFIPVGYRTNIADATMWARDACYKKNGMFTGGFAPGQTKWMCPKSKNTKWGTKFEVQNQNPSQSFDLGDDDCYNSLLSEIRNCQWGGQSSYAGWRFK